MTQREPFLEEIGIIIPPASLCAPVKPHYPPEERGRLSSREAQSQALHSFAILSRMVGKLLRKPTNTTSSTLATG